MSRKVEVDRIQAIAVSPFASALLERCQVMLVRLTSSRSFEAEVEDFRRQAVRHLKSAVPSGLSDADEADAMLVACEQIEDVCAEWLRNQPSGSQAPTVN